MHIEKYLSHTFQNVSLKSSSQLILDKAADAYDGDGSSLRVELISKYAALLCDRSVDLEEKFAFLDYHYNEYRGTKQLFLDFVKWSYTELWHEDYDVYVLTWTRKKIKPIAKGWLEGRKDSLKAVDILPDDPRIWVMKNRNTPLSADSIRFWFEGMLLIDNRKGDQIMDNESFDLFIRSWFAGTGEIATIPKDKLLKTNENGKYLMDMVKSFFQSYGTGLFNKGLRKRMAHLMPLTFDKLKGSSPTSIYANL